MKPRQKRLMFIVAGVAALGAAAGLVLYALKDNVSLYFTPTQVFNKQAPMERRFRVGGVVVERSVKREADGLTVHFDVTDTANSMPVVFTGILPDLFKEGEMTVVAGKLGADGVLHADEVLAKHNEKYVPPEAKDAMDKAKKAAAASAAK